MDLTLISAANATLIDTLGRISYRGVMAKYFQIGGKTHFFTPRRDIACACKSAQVYSANIKEVTCDLCKLTWVYYWKKQKDALKKEGDG